MSETRRAHQVALNGSICRKALMSAELPRLSDSSAASFFLADLGFGVGASGVSTAGAVRFVVIQVEAIAGRRSLIQADDRAESA